MKNIGNPKLSKEESIEDPKVKLEMLFYSKIKIKCAKCMRLRTDSDYHVQISAATIKYLSVRPTT